MKFIEIDRDYKFIDQLEGSITKEKNLSSWHLFKLAYQAESTLLSPKFNGLQAALEHLPHIQFLEHQLDTAIKAIEQMNGRVILADEVGLGKTIEAGLIIKEYMIRGLVKKVLILVPASLVNQWVNELNKKFYIPAVSFKKNYNWEQTDVIVTSIDTAKRSPHRERVLDIEYDLVLVDEAHKLKNHKTQNYSFVNSLRKKYCLLLTATPIQNELIEIFNLISILKPGHLGSYESFRKRYGKNRQQINSDKYLKQLIQKVMIRNTRKETSLNNVGRNVQTVRIRFNEDEQSVYDQLNSLLNPMSSLAKLTFLREFCSSREACYLSLSKAFTQTKDKQLQNIMNQIGQLQHHQKAKKLVEMIKAIGDEKVIIFTEYHATQYYLQWYLLQHDIKSVPYRGGFNRGKKDWMKQLFEKNVNVLIATEAGGEGINLQFCHHLINYDLPWNPMRLEQRIGRIHRYGQENDVMIYNFVIENTIEDHIMKLLYEKIHLFEQVIGQLDDILAELQIENLEKEVESIFVHSTSQGEALIKLNHLSAIIDQSSKLSGSEDLTNENY